MVATWAEITFYSLTLKRRTSLLVSSELSKSKRRGALHQKSPEIWLELLSSPSPKSSPPRPNPNHNLKEVPNSKVQLGFGVTLKSHRPPPHNF